MSTVLEKWLRDPRQLAMPQAELRRLTGAGAKAVAHIWDDVLRPECIERGRPAQAVVIYSEI